MPARPLPLIDPRRDFGTQPSTGDQYVRGLRGNWARLIDMMEGDIERMVQRLEEQGLRETKWWFALSKELGRRTMKVAGRRIR